MIKQGDNIIWHIVAVLALALPILATIFLAGASLHQNKEVVAQTSRMTCEEKIPIGEAIDRSSDMINDIYRQIEIIYRTIPGQIDAAKMMIAGAQECDLDNCKPVCSDTSCYAQKKHSECPGDFTCDPMGTCGCSDCTCSGDDCDSLSGSCTCNCTDELYGGCCLCSPFCIPKCEPQTCKGKICPDLDIPHLLVIDAFNDIDNAYEIVKATYGEEAEATEEIGEDIMFPEETADDRITQEEAIRRKLALSRIKFNECTIPLSQMEEVAQGNLSYKEPLVCGDIFERASFPKTRLDYCQDVCEEYNEEGRSASRECIECLCGSYLNFFCCH